MAIFKMVEESSATGKVKEVYKLASSVDEQRY